jgi:hypothetical protein
MSVIALRLLGVGLLGPGLPSWAEAKPVLAGEVPYQAAATVVPAPQRLPAAERRRAGVAVKVALAAAEGACADAGLDPATLPTVFTSSSGDGANCHALCETLATPQRLVSPTRFTNSVHNAAAGYWHIATANQQSSTSLCAFDASFVSGLLEAATQVQALRRPLLLVASDTPYPQPLHGVRPLPDSFGVGLVLAPDDGTGLRLALELLPASRPTACTEPALEALRHAIPAAQALPLLAALAAAQPAVVLAVQPGLALRLSRL